MSRTNFSLLQLDSPAWHVAAQGVEGQTHCSSVHNIFILMTLGYSITARAWRRPGDNGIVVEQHVCTLSKDGRR